MTGLRGLSRTSGLWAAMVCTAAWGQTGVMSVRLGGYKPNSYAQCRPMSGFGNGTGVSCIASTDCVPSESCGMMFRDISCESDLDCEMATGGPSKCVETAILPSVPPLTAMRCSAVDFAPEGMVGPGDMLFLEVYADEWDQTPADGLCENGFNSCNASNPCKSCRQQTNPPSPTGLPCHTDSDCTPPNSCLEDRHCANSGIRCEGSGLFRCAPGEACVPDACQAWPTIYSYQWTLDSWSFSNGNGPGSVLIPGHIPCTTASYLDDCRFGYQTGCQGCSVSICDWGDQCSDSSNAFVYTPRLDFLLAGKPFITACSAGTNHYTCGGAITSGGGGVPDGGTSKYLGTAVVSVGANACGSFHVQLLNDPNHTFMNDQFGVRLPHRIANYLTLEISPRPVCTPACQPDNNLCTEEVCNCSNLCVHAPAVSCYGGAHCNPNTGECEECGNGIIEESEDCDDEGESDTCNADCTIAECGDGILNMTAGEECDGSDSAACGGRPCRADCTCAPPTCGDGIVDAGEVCDGDDNERCSGRRCKADCTCSLPRPLAPVPAGP